MGGAPSIANISVQIPPLNVPTAIPPFAFNLSDYLKDLKVRIDLPAEASPEILASLKGRVERFLEVESLGGAAAADWIQISQLPPLPPEILNPEAARLEALKATAEPVKVETPADQVGATNTTNTTNTTSNTTTNSSTTSTTSNTTKEGDETVVAGAAPTTKAEAKSFIDMPMSLLGVGLLLTLAFLVAAFLISRGISGVGMHIGALKAEPVAAGGGSVEQTILAGPGPAMSSDMALKVTRNDHSLAMASQGEQLAKDFGEIVAEYPETAAESLVDLLYTNTGLVDVRDLIAFVGYDGIAPAIEHLPPSAAEVIRLAIEDLGDADILNGLRHARMIHGKTAAKRHDDKVLPERVSQLKSRLTAASDGALKSIFKSGTPEELALVLQQISMDRGLNFLGEAAVAEVKDSFQLLDQEIPNIHAVCDRITAKLDNFQEVRLAATPRQKRYFLRLASRATLDKEDSVAEIFPGTDWDLRIEWVRKHLFLRDAFYLRPGFLYDTLRTLPLNKQVQVIAVCSDNLKAAIFLAIPEGRSQEMITEELATVEGNPETMAELKNKRKEILEDYRNRLRHHMTDAEVDFAVVNECQIRKIEPPEHLKATVALVTSSTTTLAS